MESENFFKEIKPTVAVCSRAEKISTRDVAGVKADLVRKVMAETEENPEARRIVEGIDSEAFNEIMGDKFKDICPEIPQRDIHILPAANIRFHKQYGMIPEDHASFDSLADMILVDYHRLKKMFPDSIEDVVRYVVFHEQMHAASRAECEYGSYENTPIRMGFSYQVGDEHRMEMLDEAVNEKMTREVVAEYEKRKNITMSRISQTAYDVPVSFLELLIKKIAAKTREGEDAVWKQIQREKILGLEEGKTGLVDSLERMFSRTFVDDLSRSDINAVLKRLESDDENGNVVEEVSRM